VGGFPEVSRREMLRHSGFPEALGFRPDTKPKWLTEVTFMWLTIDVLLIIGINIYQRAGS